METLNATQEFQKKVSIAVKRKLLYSTMLICCRAYKSGKNPSENFGTEKISDEIGADREARENVDNDQRRDSERERSVQKRPGSASPVVVAILPSHVRHGSDEIRADQLLVSYRSWPSRASTWTAIFSQSSSSEFSVFCTVRSMHRPISRHTESIWFRHRVPCKPRPIAEISDKRNSVDASESIVNAPMYSEHKQLKPN